MQECISFDHGHLSIPRVVALFSNTSFSFPLFLCNFSPPANFDLFFRDRSRLCRFFLYLCKSSVELTVLFSAMGGVEGKPPPSLSSSLGVRYRNFASRFLRPRSNVIGEILVPPLPHLHAIAAFPDLRELQPTLCYADALLSFLPFLPCLSGTKNLRSTTRFATRDEKAGFNPLLSHLAFLLELPPLIPTKAVNRFYRGEPLPRASHELLLPLVFLRRPLLCSLSFPEQEGL